MGERIERELKLRLPGAAAFAAVCERLGAAGPPAVQVNHFFDTAERRLRAARIALRLRDEDGAWTLTLKGPARGPEGFLATRAEEELAVEPETARAILAGARCPLAALEASALRDAELVRAARAHAGDAALVHLGSFENERTRVGPLALAGLPERLVLELDRTRFPDGTTEHELEAELPDGADAGAARGALARVLAGLGIAAEPAESKAARFFRALAARADDLTHP